MEVAYAARKSADEYPRGAGCMKEAGLGSMCGTAAEILVDSIRETICREKISTSRMGAYYQRGAYAGHSHNCHDHVRSLREVADRVQHLAILRKIQDETHGFTEFVPLSFIHMNTPIFRAETRAGGSDRERGSPDGRGRPPLIWIISGTYRSPG